MPACGNLTGEAAGPPPSGNSDGVAPGPSLALDRFPLCSSGLRFHLARTGIASLISFPPKGVCETRRLVSRELLPHRLPALSHHPSFFFFWRFQQGRLPESLR